MAVKRFFAPDMRQALKQIKTQMGADAIILSNRNVATGVEVVAALESDDYRSFGVDGGASAAVESRANAVKTGIGSSRDNSPSTTERLSTTSSDTKSGKYATTPHLEALKDQQVSRHGETLRETLSQLKDKHAKQDELNAAAYRGKQQNYFEYSNARLDASRDSFSEVGEVQSELSNIRRLLEQRLSGIAWDHFSTRTPVQATIWERLSRMGIPAQLCKKLMEKVHPDHNTVDAWRFTLAHLTRAIPIQGEDVVAGGGTFSFVGPTGVGKTTTIGKLATRYVINNGPESVALVTTDSYRIAAHEQLRTFGRILGVSVRIVDDRHSLESTLESLRHKSLILIDTAGLHPKDPNLIRQLKSLQKNSKQIKNYLVAACTSQYQVLKSAYHTYSKAGLSGCVLSKLDETGSLGEALSLLIEYGLEATYETDGQNIPDDIHIALPHHLISKAVALSKKNETNKEELVNKFGGVYAQPADFREGFASLS